MTAKYRAFISYSHADSTRAEWLHKALERYRVPASYVGMKNVKGEYVEARLGTIFRDRDELTSGADLAEAIRDALTASENLIVICSPAAARSRYVNQEIIEFKRLGRAHRVHGVIVAGEPHASAVAATEEQECLPPALRFAVDEAGALTDRPAPEVLAADLRAGKDEKTRALLKLIAGLLGIDFDVLYQRDRRRARRTKLAITALASTLAVILAVLGWTAFERSREARRQERLVAHDAYATALGLVETSARAGDHDKAVEQLKKYIPAEGADDLREFAWHYLWRPYDRHRHAVFVSGKTSSLDISADGKRFVLANDSSLITVWDIATGKELGRIEDRAARFRTAFFVAGGTRVATEDRDGEVRVWKLEHPREQERSLGKGLYPTLSRERKTLIVARGTFPELEDARLVNTENGAETALHPEEKGFPLTIYSISADERLVAFADYRNAVLVFDVRTGRKLRRRVFAGEWKLQDVNFTPDGMLLVEGAGRGAALEIRVWDPATDSEGPVLRVPGGPAAKTVAVASSANGGRIALLRGDSTTVSPTQESHLTVWERRTGRLLYDLREAQTGFVTAMQFSPTADVLATGSRNHEVKLWNASTGALQGVVGIHHGTPTRRDEEAHAHIETGTVFHLSQSQGAGINTLLFSADGRSIVTASGEFAAVRVWDATVDPSAQDLPVKGDSHTAIAFSPDGRFVFTADRSGVMATWDAARRIKTAQVVGHTTPVFGLAVSPDGARLASASSDGVLKIWRVPQLIEEARWTGAAGTTEHLVLANDRVTHLTRRPEGTGAPPQYGTYDVQQFTVGGTPLCCRASFTAAVTASSADGNRTAWFRGGLSTSGTGGCAVAIQDVQRGRSQVLLGRDSCLRLSIAQLAWSPDGTLLAVGGAAVRLGGPSPLGTLAGVRLFEIPSGRERTMLPLPGGYTTAAALSQLSFSPDGRSLATLTVAADPRNPRARSHPERPEVAVWDVASSSRKSALSVPQESCGAYRGAQCFGRAAFSPDSAVLGVVTLKTDGAGSDVLFWRIGDKDFSTVKSRNRVEKLLFSPAGEPRVAALTRSRDFGEPAILWDRRPSPQVAALGSYVPEITAVHPLPDGHLLAQTLEYPVTFDGVSRVWDLETGGSIASAVDHTSTGHRTIDVSLDGRLFGALSTDGKVTITQRGGTEPVMTIAAESMDTGRPPSFTAQALLLFSPDGRRLATFGQSQTKMWDLATGKNTLTLNGTVPAAFSRDNRVLATRDADCNTVVVTDASSGRQRARVLSANGCVKELALSPDGTRLLSIRSDLQLTDYISEATVWDVRSGTVAAVLSGYTDHGNSAAAFSPDGKTIVTAGIGGTVNLWDPVGGRRLLTLAGPAVDVAAVAFSDAGDVLIAGYKTELRFWRGTLEQRTGVGER